MNQASRKSLSFLLCALIVPCLLTPSLTSIYPITQGVFSWDMVSGFMLINAGLIIGTLTISSLCENFNWRVFLATYLITLLLFTGNVLLIVFAWPHYDAESLASLAIQSFVKAGLVEEFFKLVSWLPWILVESKTNSYFVLWIAGLSGLLFGVCENCHMLAVLSFTPGIANGDILVTAFGDSIFLAVAYVRFLWGPLLHVSLTLIGYCMYANLRDRKSAWIFYLLVVVVPAALHGIYDLVTYVGNHMEVLWCTHVGPVIAFTINLISLVMLIRI